MGKLESKVQADFSGYAPYAEECIRNPEFHCPLLRAGFYKCRTLAEAREAAIRNGLIISDKLELPSSKGHKLILENRPGFTAYCFKQSNNPDHPCGSSRVTPL